MVLGDNHTEVSGGHALSLYMLKVGYIPPSYLSRISFPSEQRLVGCPELDQPFHILFSH